jgi:DNA polymerase V
VRLFGLVDCNSFYASCEKVFRPELAHRPVVVLSNNDGCVVARSPEAKALGMEMGAPYFKVRTFCAREGVAVFSSNYALYGDMSRRVMDALSRWTPAIEVYSIDEAFLELTGTQGADTEAFGRDLVRTVRQWTGIPVSLGLGPTKTLAKVANRVAKQSGRGVHLLLDEAGRERCLAEMEIEEIWGVSSRWGARLRRMGIQTARQLRDADTNTIRKSFSVVLERLVRELRGEVCLELEEAPEAKKNITVSRSFGHLVTELADLEEAVATYAARAGEKLRAQDGLAGAIYVYIRTNRFRKDDPQYANAVSIGFPRPTSHGGDLIAAALGGLRRMYRPGYRYKKAGVILLDLVNRAAADAQGDLFGLTEDRVRGDRLMAVVDRLNRVMGRDTVAFASQGIERPWKLRADLRSPRYTTRWEELPTARAG